MTLRVFVHVLPGLIALALAAAVVLRLGSQRQKTAMAAVLICWIGATVGQMLSGDLTVPLIVGDVVFSLWLFWFVWRRPEWWLWSVLAIEGARLLLHAVAYAAFPGAAYTMANNALSLAGLANLAAAAIWAARRRPAA